MIYIIYFTIRFLLVPIFSDGQPSICGVMNAGRQSFSICPPSFTLHTKALSLVYCYDFAV